MSKGEIKDRKTAALKEEELEKVVGGAGSTEEKTDGDLGTGTNVKSDGPLGHFYIHTKPKYN